jgi:translation initiation factor IF-1
VGSDETVEDGGRRPGGRGSEAVRSRDRGRLVEGSVVEERPSLVFAVKLDSQQTVLAHLAGMAERNFVRLVPGDRVEVELAPHDPTRGKIIQKLVKAS